MTGAKKVKSPLIRDREKEEREAREAEEKQIWRWLAKEARRVEEVSLLTLD